ncbi:ribonuclease H-like domain-containing protein [Tanacetum coccineum]
MSQPANDEFSQHLSDEESNHEEASDTGAAPKQQQQVIPQTTAISNIKLPILKKEEYDIWAMEMEHYLEYIDNEVWKVIQNGNSKKRISTGKDGIVRVLSPVTAAEIQAVEKERKAKNILLMAIPKEHMRRFHGMDDAKEIWEAIRTRFGGNANSKKMQKAVFKQQFEAFKISNSEGLEKGYDRFQQLLSQLEAHGAEVSTEDANHKFLRSLPSAWSNLAMTMRTNPEIDNLSIDDLYNNLRVFEQEIQGASKTSSSAQNVAFVSQSKSSTNKVKSGFTGAYSTCTPSTSSTNVPEKEVLAGFADEVIYSLFAKQTEDLDLLHEDLEQIDNENIEYTQRNKNKNINGKVTLLQRKRKKKCFVCGSLSHLIKDCDYYEKKMDREAEYKLNAGRPKFNSVRPNINTGRTNINSVRPKVNASASYNWRNTRPNFNYNSGPTFVRTVNANGPQGRPKPVKAWVTRINWRILKNSMGDLLPLEVAKATYLILLKVPRHHNMYSFDMKTPSPAKGFACLIAKATSDESKLWHRRFSWVFFLASKDETSGILQTFIRQIENQLSHRVKIIRSDNGTEFKNRDMLEFCGNKGIKQEYSNARTPQQNGVAERMNKTLIEAARTMLADSLLPTTFWAEAVSTACYIFNRVFQWITNNAGTSQNSKSIVSEEKDEEVELIVVPSAVKTPEEKDESRKSSTNSKKEEILTELQKEKKDSSTDSLEDNPKDSSF